jgi:uncharacterized glyoxalase superfamily protein PhnB
MKVLVFVKATHSSETGELPSEQLLTEMGQFNEELVKAGIMKAGEGLKPSSQGVRVRFSGKERFVIDGPFAETKELVAGYWVWEVSSMVEAVEWVKRCPNPMPEESEIEIRPVYEMSDFAEMDPTGSVAQQEEELMTAMAGQASEVQPYLFFSGRCEEALEFYRQTIGARIGMVLRFEESPDPVPEGMLQPGFEQKIMHSSFHVGDLVIRFRLALSVGGEADAHRIFNALADGGHIDMPLTKTFWSPCYGMVTDKFNVGWMVMVRGEAP